MGALYPVSNCVVPVVKVIGLDPGLDGALAFLELNPDTGKLTLMVLRMPAVSAKAKGRDLNVSELAQDFNLMYFGAEHAFLEKVGAMPNQGVSSMFKFGYTCGVPRGLIAAYGIPVTYVPPAKWKGDLRLGSTKEYARFRAAELFPDYAHEFKRVKDDGPAEAALIAWWGLKSLGVIR